MKQGRKYRKWRIPCDPYANIGGSGTEGPLGQGCFFEQGMGCFRVPVSLTSLCGGRFNLPCLISSSMTRNSANCWRFFSCSFNWMSTREQTLPSFSLEPERGNGRFQKGWDILPLPPPTPPTDRPIDGKTGMGGGTKVVGFFFLRIIAGLKRQLKTPGTNGWFSVQYTVWPFCFTNVPVFWSNHND